MPEVMKKRRLIFGCGYLGLRVARLWKKLGCEVHAVTRSPVRAKELLAEGIQPVVGDISQIGELDSLPECGIVLFAVGFDHIGLQSIREVYVNGLQRALMALGQGTRKFIYVSSTGVYGQASGQWVDESSACQPTREGGQACLAAEQLLMNHAIGARAIILRLAGIYGPGRVPRRRQLEAGLPLAAPGQGYLNLIHVDDAARCILAAAQLAKPPSLYCVADGQPVLRSDYYLELARLLNAPLPVFTTPSPSDPAAQRATASKRIDSSRLRDELDIRLTYPSYREGLAHIVADENGDLA